MAIYEQAFLRPGQYDLGGGATRTLTAQELTRLQANTQALLAEGYEIPVLLRHPAAGSTAGGPRPPQGQSIPPTTPPTIPPSSPQAAADFPSPLGRLVSVRLGENGALVHSLELPYEDEAELVEGVGLRNTSPELRETFTDAAGQERGPIIAHIALTSRPRVADQPPLALAPGAVRLSLRDWQTAPEETASPAPAAFELGEPATPAAAVEIPLAAEAALGPQDLAPAELVALGAEVVGEQAAAVASTQERRYRQELAERIRHSQRLPLGLRQRLADSVGAVQLSRDGDEEPSLRLSDAVELLEEALPEQLALTGSRSALAVHPGGERFFTGERGALSDDEATRVAREQLLATGFARRE